MLQRPEEGEYPVYFHKYIEKVPETDVLEFLNSQLSNQLDYVKNIADDQMDHKYGEDKWTVRQVLSHINDVERIFGYRALACLRNDSGKIPGFEQDDYVANANFSNMSKEVLVEEFQALRMANIAMVKSADQSEWTRKCNINGNDTSARSMIYMLAGHVIHHKILFDEKYFK